jgi:hypothetical protein
VIPVANFDIVIPGATLKCIPVSSIPELNPVTDDCADEDMTVAEDDELVVAGTSVAGAQELSKIAVMNTKKEECFI